MILVNAIYKEDVLPLEYAEGLIKLLSPITPFMAEEIWNKFLHHNTTIAYAKWPEYDESKTIDEEISLPIQINGKLKGNITITMDEDESNIKQKVHNAISSKLDGKKIVKEIYVKNKIYNIVTE